MQALEQYNLPHYRDIIGKVIEHLREGYDPDQLIHYMKNAYTEKGLTAKPLWSIIRIALTGSAGGTSIKNLLEMIDREAVISRLHRLVQ